jgi:HlyD family secretion protein
MKNKNIAIISMLATGLLISACSGTGSNGNDALTASGTISAQSVKIAPEIGGKISEISVSEGQAVKAGEALFSINGDLIQSQYDQASAAVDSAQAGLDTSSAQLKSVEIQHQLTLQNARLQSGEATANEWRINPSTSFEVPVWYFSRDEKITTAQSQVGTAAAEVMKEIDALEAVLADIDNGDFIALEQELATAQNSFLVAKAAQDVVSRALENEEIKDAAEDSFDLSETVLENVQKRYDQALSTEDEKNVLEARGKVGAAQAMYDAAVNQLLSNYIGDDSLQVQAASASVNLAEKSVTQAKAGLVQAEAALETVEIQLGKTEVSTPISGLVLSQNLEIGELVGAGGIVMTIGNIDEVSLTVYVPEDEYGLVKLEQEVFVKVDSFPNKTYMGIVRYISDSAEFTPSNVQTVEGRKTTVFAVEISIENTSHDLKPGMPADVTFLID